MERNADDATTRSTEEPEEVTVEHHPERKRFEVNVAGVTAVLEYLRAGGSMIFTHTGVPEAAAGRGVGSALARAGLDYVREHDMVAVPLCPFVRGFIRRHPEYQELVGFGERGDRLT